NRELSREVERLRGRVLELEGLADMDAMLPVYNRRAFVREVGRAQSVVSRYGILSSVVFIDLDGFKSVNDRHGHATGDAVLERVSHALLSGVRSCDMVARLGGDEFGVLLFKCAGAVARAKGASLTCRIGDVSVITPSGPLQVKASWGAADCDADGSVADILSRADAAMYANKREAQDF
ncbi:MAG: GGDEF domain-containing protein, partial [Litorimonas sp.]